MVHMEKSEIAIVISIYIALFLVIVLGVIACWKAVERLEKREELEAAERAAAVSEPTARSESKRVRFAATVQVC